MNRQGKPVPYRGKKRQMNRSTQRTSNEGEFQQTYKRKRPPERSFRQQSKTDYGFQSASDRKQGEWNRQVQRNQENRRPLNQNQVNNKKRMSSNRKKSTMRPASKNARRVSGSEKWIISMSILSIFLLIGLVFFVFFVGSATVVDDSMTPTFENGTKVLYNKDAKLHVGDVVIMASPDETQYNQMRRVLGLPGQKVDYLSDNSIVIDGVILQETYFKHEVQQTSTERLNDVSMSQFLELTPSLTQSMIQANKIPNDMILVLGDDRLNAFDSRNYGLVPLKNIKGRATITYWPPKKIKNK